MVGRVWSEAPCCCCGRLNTLLMSTHMYTYTYATQIAQQSCYIQTTKDTHPSHTYRHTTHIHHITHIIAYIITITQMYKCTYGWDRLLSQTQESTFPGSAAFFEGCGHGCVFISTDIHSTLGFYYYGSELRAASENQILPLTHLSFYPNWLSLWPQTRQGPAVPHFTHSPWKLGTTHTWRRLVW